MVLSNNWDPNAHTHTHTHTHTHRERERDFRSLYDINTGSMNEFIFAGHYKKGNPPWVSTLKL